MTRPQGALCAGLGTWAHGGREAGSRTHPDLAPWAEILSVHQERKRERGGAIRSMSKGFKNSGRGVFPPLTVGR